MKNALLFVLAWWSFSGCSTLKVRLPYAAVQSPENSAKDTLNIVPIRLTSYNQYEVTRDASERPPVLNAESERSVTREKFLSAAALYSPSDRFKVELLLGGEAGLGAQYVAFEKRNSEGAGAHLVSLFGHVSYLQFKNSGDQKGEFGFSGFNWNASAITNNRNLGISYGYKTSNFMPYVGMAYNHLDTKWSIEQKTSTDGTSPAAFYSSDKSGYSRTVSAGFVFGDADKFQLAVNYSELFYGSQSFNEGYFSGALSRSFPEIFSGETKYEIFPKERWALRDFGALGLSYFVGFGSGQYVQNNSNKGLGFLAVDTAALFQILNSIGESETNRSGSSLNFGLVVFAISRVWQFVDVIQSASSSEQRKVITQK